MNSDAATLHAAARGALAAGGATKPPPPAVTGVQTVLLEGTRGALCALYFEPQAGLPARGDVLVVPAFAEEMNRCRAMVSLQARTWAGLGIGTLVIDPFGTGDSAGEFVDATWAQWRADLHLGADWLDQHAGGCRTLLGVRLGALMAAELAALRPGVQRLLLWQPVLSGKSFYTQFLRIRIAAELSLPNRVKSTNELRQMGAAGQAVEVSGYEIGPALARGLDELTFDAAALTGRVAIDWFEVQPQPQADSEVTLAPASLKTIEALQAAGAAVHAQAVEGPAFWHVHERELAPRLIEQSSLCAGRWSPAATPSTAHSTLRGVAAALAAQSAGASPAHEYLLAFDCADERLLGCMHRGSAHATRGVVIVVAGGPQYRAGAHRQFVSLARKLADCGFPVLRFDLRGMGDSSGSYAGFEHSAPDIRAAVDALLAQQPQLHEVVLVGECESASGILFYAWRDPRVCGTVLVNPWVRTEEGQAQVILKDYYLDRIRSAAFWHKVRSGQFELIGSLRSLVAVIKAYVRGRRLFARASLGAETDELGGLPLPVKTATGLSRFKGRVLLLMSGHDYIAREFDEVTTASRAWDGLLASPRLVRADIAGADHTFSKKVWKDAAAQAVVNWLRSW